MKKLEKYKLNLFSGIKGGWRILGVTIRGGSTYWDLEVSGNFYCDFYVQKDC